MPPTEIRLSPCELVFAWRNGTYVYIDRQFRNAIFDYRLAFSVSDRLLFCIPDLYLIRPRVRSDWQLNQKRQQTAGNFDRLGVCARACGFDRTRDGRIA